MKNIFLIILISFIVSLIIWDIFFRKKPILPPEISYQYETDTIWDSIPYIVPEPYPIYTQPYTVTIYTADTNTINSLKMELVEKDLIIISLTDTIRIYEGYLKQYPSNPKLLALDLKKDSMSIGLLNITGIPQENKWPIDLARFNYRWNYVVGLTRYPTLMPPTKERSPFEYFVGGGVDLLYLSPYVSGRIEKDWASMRLYGNINLGLLNKNISGIKLGVDYNFNGTNSNRIR